MNEPDDNGELHPTIPKPLANMHVFVVIVENNETGALYAECIQAFRRESDAEAYANSFNQHWLTTRVLLIPVKC